MTVGDILLEVIGVPTQGQIEEAAAVRKSKRAKVAPVVPTPTPKVNIPSLGLKASSYIEKSGGLILRYPYEALTESTDYLQIDIRQYNSVAANNTGSIISDGSRRINESPNILPKKLPSSGLSRKKLVNAGTILLPMPSNIQDGNSVSYASGNLDGITAGIFDAIKSGIKNAPGGSNTNPIQQMMSSASGVVGNLAGKFTENQGAIKDIIMSDIMSQAANIPLGGSLTRDAVFARTSGEILNQNVELLFNGVTLRSFKFSFKFTPRGPKEAQQVGLIINTFKQNMAAKLGNNSASQSATANNLTANISSNNMFLKTPNVFELTYKTGNGPHPFLNSFKQCVLTDMSVNYTGEGTYAVYDDSTPVSMVLELGFKELEPIYDADYGAEPGVGY